MRFKQRSNMSWHNCQIISAIEVKEALWARCRRAPNAHLKAEFRCARNVANALIRAFKQCYFPKGFSEARSNPREAWPLIDFFWRKCIEKEPSRESD